MKWHRLYKESSDSDFVIKNGVLVEYRGKGGNVVIPKGVTRIMSDAFPVGSSLTSITIPSSVTDIGDQAFYGCSRLTSITIKGKSKKEAKNLLEYSVDDLSIVKGEETSFVVRFKYSHRTDDEQEFNASSPEEARRKFEIWAADMENSEDFDFEFIDAKEA